VLKLCVRALCERCLLKMSVGDVAGELFDRRESRAMTLNSFYDVGPGEGVRCLVVMHALLYRPWINLCIVVQFNHCLVVSLSSCPSSGNTLSCSYQTKQHHNRIDIFFVELKRTVDASQFTRFTSVWYRSYSSAQLDRGACSRTLECLYPFLAAIVSGPRSWSEGIPCQSN